MLRAGGTVAFPTDTVYALGANSLNRQAVREVFRAKVRPMGDPVPLLVANLEMLRSAVEDIPDIGMDLIRHFMPGPLTLVLKRGPSVLDEVTAGGPTVGVRIPDHPIPVALARALGAPLVGTSANRSGFQSVTTPQEVRAQLGDGVGYILEGDCWGKRESTVIDLTGRAPRVLREGAIPTQSLAACLQTEDIQ